MSELYTKIEDLCKENNTNITELCRELKIPRSPLSELKAGRSKTISPDKLVQIADYFNVSVDWLMGKSLFRNNNEVGEYYSGWGAYESDFDPPFEFCSLLESERQEQGYSVADMAEVIGATATQYTEYEEGVAPITYAQAEKLCSFLGTDVSQVLFDNNHYDGEVPEEYHNNVRGWERMKQIAEDEAMRESYEDEDIKIVARHLEDIPSDKREALIKNINSTIKLYKEAMGLNKRED